MLRPKLLTLTLLYIIFDREGNLFTYLQQKCYNPSLNFYLSRRDCPSQRAAVSLKDLACKTGGLFFAELLQGRAKHMKEGLKQLNDSAPTFPFLQLVKRAFPHSLP